MTEYLLFANTGFFGDLPRMPIGLTELDCTFTFITGGLTNENFAGLNNLNYIVLNQNNIVNSIPTVFGELPSLEFMYVQDTLISGDLAFMDGPGKMPVITQLWIDNNPNMGGTLPTTIGTMSTLASLSLTVNNLTGTIPSEIGQLGAINMRELWLFDNKLVGTIPTEFGNLLKMSIFQVEGNDLTGTMPSALCNSFFLTVLGADCAEVTVSI